MNRQLIQEIPARVYRLSVSDYEASEAVAKAGQKQPNHAVAKYTEIAERSRKVLIATPSGDSRRDGISDLIGEILACAIFLPLIFGLLVFGNALMPYQPSMGSEASFQSPHHHN